MITLNLYLRKKSNSGRICRILIEFAQVQSKFDSIWILFFEKSQRFSSHQNFKSELQTEPRKKPILWEIHSEFTQISSKFMQIQLNFNLQMLQVNLKKFYSSFTLSNPRSNLGRVCKILDEFAQVCLDLYEYKANLPNFRYYSTRKQRIFSHFCSMTIFKNDVSSFLLGN